LRKASDDFRFGKRRRRLWFCYGSDAVDVMLGRRRERPLRCILRARRRYQDGGHKKQSRRRQDEREVFTLTHALDPAHNKLDAPNSP